MLTEEYGLPREIRSPFVAAASTFSAFLVCGLVPLAPYVLGMQNPLPLSIILTGIVFFVIGSAKSHWSTSSWWSSGLSTLLVGAVAATLSYITGLAMRLFIE
jgi:VIT1/CCC1 family predicted Fe2+/Mn2+ transporter